MFRTLTNHDFYKSLVDVTNEEDNNVLSGVPYPPPCTPFTLLAQLESTPPFLLNTHHVD